MSDTTPDPATGPDDGTGPTGGDDPASAPVAGGVRNLVEWVAIIVGALTIALVVKTFLFQVFLIPSPSMFPTLREDDRVVVNKLSYRLHDVNRGDLVVFERPPSSAPTGIDHLIKRVVATGGETVSAEGGEILIDGEPLDEPYLEPDVATAGFPPQDVPEGHVWVMGDNRGNSGDSRVFGPIDEDLVVGRAFVKIWPLDDISGL